MGVTRYDFINAETANAKIVAALPTAATTYYGNVTGQDSIGVEWQGGELAYLTTSDKLHVQTATSGVTATWRVIDTAFATTSSTSTSTSTTTSSSRTGVE